MNGRHGTESSSCTMTNGGKSTGGDASPLGSPSGDDQEDERNVDQITRWILDAIEVIRHEQQRPSLDRIVQKMKYKHNTDAGVVEDRVRTAVKCGRIVKIFSNQGISYNDPVQMRKVSNRILTLTPTSDLSRHIVRCIREISEPSSLVRIEQFSRHTFDLRGLDALNFRDMIAAGLRQAVEQKLLIELQQGGSNDESVITLYDLPAKSSISAMANSGEQKNDSGPPPNNTSTSTSRDSFAPKVQSVTLQSGRVGSMWVPLRFGRPANDEVGHAGIRRDPSTSNSSERNRQSYDSNNGRQSITDCGSTRRRGRPKKGEERPRINPNQKKHCWNKDHTKRPLFEFQDAWLAPDDPQEQEQSWPRWREWLSRVPFNPNAAYCNVCKQEIILGYIGKIPISNHARSNKHKAKLRTRNEPTISDGETYRSGTLFIEDTGAGNKEQGGKRESSSLARNSSTQSKRARQISKSGSESNSTSRDSSSPQNQAETSQGGFPPLSDVSVVLERHPSIERQITLNPAVHVAPEYADSSASNAFERNHQPYDLHRSTNVGNSTNVCLVQGPRIESVFTIKREENNVVDAHRECNEKHRAIESQLGEIKDKYIAALEMNGDQANTIRDLEFRIATLSQRNQELLKALAAANCGAHGSYGCQRRLVGISHQ